MIIEIAKLWDAAIIPTKAYKSDAGYDLYCQENYNFSYGKLLKVVTGIAINIPCGNVGIIKDRSSIASKGLHILGGVIDSGYTGELTILMIKLTVDGTPIWIDHGSKIAQLVIVPLSSLGNIELIVVDKLSETERGEKGFGSSNTIHYRIAGQSTRNICGEVGEFSYGLSEVTCPKCMGEETFKYVHDRK